MHLDRLRHAKGIGRCQIGGQQAGSGQRLLSKPIQLSNRTEPFHLPFGALHGAVRILELDKLLDGALCRCESRGLVEHEVA